MAITKHSNAYSTNYHERMPTFSPRVYLTVLPICMLVFRKVLLNDAQALAAGCTSWCKFCVFSAGFWHKQPEDSQNSQELAGHQHHGQHFGVSFSAGCFLRLTASFGPALRFLGGGVGVGWGGRHMLTSWIERINFVAVIIRSCIF